MNTSSKPIAHHDDAHAHAHEVQKHVKAYLMVGGMLLICTALTVFLSYVDFGTQKANIIVAMLVAAFKAGLVAAIFMHLSHEKWTIYRFLLFTVIFAIGLFVLSILAFHDPIHL